MNGVELKIVLTGDSPEQLQAKTTDLRFVGDIDPKSKTELGNWIKAIAAMAKIAVEQMPLSEGQPVPPDLAEVLSADLGAGS